MKRDDVEKLVVGAFALTGWFVAMFIVIIGLIIIF